ncbi:MAG: alpha-xylosidase [Spirochaetales bacterium]|nr:alpha-xylosidase [Spirochaetales bacterium]
MKFSNGFWLLQDDVTLTSPMEVRDVRKQDKGLTLYGPAKKIETRGDTLNLPQITIELSAPAKNVIKVRMFHFDGDAPARPQFILRDDGYDGAVAEYDEKSVTFRSGDLAFEIRDRGTWNPVFTWKGSVITGSQRKSAGYIKKDDGSAFFREQLDLDVDETIYGLGERFTPFVKNGQVVDIWNEDGGTSSEQAYKSIPFYLSSKGYGVLVNNPGKVSFEVASEAVSRVQFSVSGEELEYFIIGGDSPKEALSGYTTLSGRPALPPAWSFGLWLTTSFTTSYDEDTVNSFIDGMADRDIPLQVFHFDCYWMKEFQWCDFQWDPDVFPDPEGMLARLKKKGLHTCLWINPYIARKSVLFDEGKEKGYLVRKPDGGVWQWDMWQAGMALVDFTNPDAVKWFQSKLRPLLEQGADCFKTDFGERIPVDVCWHDGSDPERMHNYYTQLYNKAVFDLLEEVRGKGETALFARSATVGGQQFPVHWGGDCSASYASMAESLRGGLSLCMSGFGFWSHDIGGFEQTATPDLYKRWAAFGLLSTHSRLHGSESYRVPWNFDDEACDVLRYFTKLKNSLMPYLFSSACETSETGVPMMRPMILEYPEDPTCAWLDKQYMLGESLLVAPIFNDRGQASYYLPEGVWFSLIDGSGKEGGRWYKEDHSYMSIPLYARFGSIVARGQEDRADYDYTKGLTLEIYGIEEGVVLSTELRDGKGSMAVTVSAERKGSEVLVRADGASGDFTVRIFRQGNDAVEASGRGEVRVSL